jgi:hypothetical protein
VADVALSPVQGGDLLRVDIEAQDAEAFLDEGQGEREPHVALPDDADQGLAVVDLAEEGVSQCGDGRRGHGWVLLTMLRVVAAWLSPIPAGRGAIVRRGRVAVKPGRRRLA